MVNQWLATGWPEVIQWLTTVSLWNRTEPNRTVVSHWLASDVDMVGQWLTSGCIGGFTRYPHMNSETAKTGDWMDRETARGLRL